MNVEKTMNTNRNPLTTRIALACCMLMASPAFAGIDRVSTVTNNVQLVVGGIALAVFTICITIAGYKLAFGNARFPDVFPILLGGMLAGGAGGMAAWLLG